MVRWLLPLGLIIMATLLEAGGDALVRTGLRPGAAGVRVLLMAAGAVALFGYGLVLNLSPLDWGRLMGAYVATFFVVGQIINQLVFNTAPALPVLVGGGLIVAGGAVATLWQP